MGRRSIVLACACAALVVGCGAKGGGRPAPTAPNTNDKRAAALACLTGEKHLRARPRGDDSIQVGDPASGPRVKFFLTGGEAEAFQFEGHAEGTEQIGRSLLFTRHGSDKVLVEIEDCLDSV
jgi:hypothetical protein